MARLRVLVTGFGPFPGAPENPSAWLVEALVAQTPPSDCELHAAVLPTEWEAVAALTPAIYETVQPRVMIHFGLCQRAPSFRIERSAHNRIAPRVDASAALPAARVVLADGADRIDTNLPSTQLAAHLRARGVTASPSRSAGRYLCNFLYYRSLAWAARQANPCFALFVHIPPSAARGGPFSDAALLNGAEEVLRFVIGFADLHAAPEFPPLPSAGVLPIHAGDETW